MNVACLKNGSPSGHRGGERRSCCAVRLCLLDVLSQEKVRRLSARVIHHGIRSPAWIFPASRSLIVRLAHIARGFYPEARAFPRPATGNPRLGLGYLPAAPFPEPRGAFQ